MKNDQVKLLQRMLATYFKFDQTVFVNGVYDNVTIKTVQVFQQREGILASGSPATNGYGLAGPKTRARLNVLYAVPNVAALTPAERQTLIAQLQERVRQLQALLQTLLQKLGR